MLSSCCCCTFRQFPMSPGSIAHMTPSLSAPDGRPQLVTLCWSVVRERLGAQDKLLSLVSSILVCLSIVQYERREMWELKFYSLRAFERLSKGRINLPIHYCHKDWIRTGAFTRISYRPPPLPQSQHLRSPLQSLALDGQLSSFIKSSIADWIVSTLALDLTFIQAHPQKCEIGPRWDPQGNLHILWERKMYGNYWGSFSSCQLLRGTTIWAGFFSARKNPEYPRATERKTA